MAAAAQSLRVARRLVFATSRARCFTAAPAVRSSPLPWPQAPRSFCAAVPAEASKATKNSRAQDEETSFVRADTDPAALGGAVAARLRKLGAARVRAVGSKAAYRGMKGLVNADDYLKQDEGAPAGRRVVVIVHQKAEAESLLHGEVKRTVVTMEASLSTDVPNSSAPPRLVKIGAETNPGKAAAAMKIGLKESSREAGVMIRAMGAVAVHKALMAAIYCQQYLQTDGDGITFVVVPGFELMEPTASGADGGEAAPKKQMVLRLYRTDTPTRASNQAAAG